MTSNDSFKNFALGANTTILNAVSLKEHLTLRNACTDYRDANGARWVHNDIPEASAAVSFEQIPCLNKFRNIIGHMENSEIICFKLQACNNFIDMIYNLSENLAPALESGRLWAIPKTTHYKLSISNKLHWSESGNPVPNIHYDVLNKLNCSKGTPLSACTTHAAMESDHYRNDVNYEKIFLYPHNAAISVGLIGSLHDNECIDMSPGEDSKNANIENRSYRIEEYLGFICSGHTSHSTEAGRVRRVTCSTRVRILTSKTVVTLMDIAEYITENSNIEQTHVSDIWTIFCMGMYCNITYKELVLLCSQHRIMSLTELTPFSLHICNDTKLVVISISSGTLIKQCSNGYWADNIEVHKSFRVKSSIKPRIDTTGEDHLRACFSAYFSLIPYISENRAPRPLIASVQTPQAVCIPWCPGNAAVTPCYTFNPLVTTKLYSSVLQDIKNGDASISAYLPGENVQCLFLNLENTYEDAFMVSKRYVDNGGFSTISMCSYNISRSEYILPVGSTMCGVLCKWWKSPCQKGCKHDPNFLNKGSSYTVGYNPTGVVHSITELNNGDVNVRVRSHQQLQNGDKLSMGHGQKGVAVITEYEDMPIAYHPKHGQIVPDIVMAMSSVVTRQTNGLLFEAARSLSLFSTKESTPYTIKTREKPDIEDEFVVVSGITGKLYKTLVFDKNGDWKLQPTAATLGIVRVFNQTQMSRERHQISHLGVGKNSLRTPSGRAKGGGVKWGEMEVISTSSAGLQCCDDEISSRGDQIVGKWCTMCQRLGLLCTCTTENNHIQAVAPYDLVITDCINAVVFNGSFQYTFTQELG